MAASPLGWFISCLPEGDIRYTVDFYRNDDELPLHISIRPADKRIVFNRRSAEGWQSEIWFDCDGDDMGAVTCFVLQLDNKIVIKLNSTFLLIDRSEEIDLRECQIVTSDVERIFVYPLFQIASSALENLIAHAEERGEAGNALAARSATGIVEGFDGAFILWGWACSKSFSSCKIEVEVAGQLIDCIVRAVIRGDVFGRRAQPNEELGFEIELPGYIWTLAGQDDVINIRVTADGDDLTLGHLNVTRSDARTKLLEYCRGGAHDAESQALVLLALEHLAKMGDRQSLSDNDRRLIRDLSEQFKLSSLFDDHNNRDAPGGHVVSAAIDTETRRYAVIWSALRELSAKLSEHGPRIGHVSVFNEVKEIVDSRRFRGITRRNFVVSAFDVLCDSHELARISEIMDVTEFDYLAQAHSVSELSSAASILMAQRRFDEAVSTLFHAAKLRSGWLSTSGVSYVSHRLIECLEEEVITEDLARQVFYAILELAKTGADDWFGRGFDERLTLAVVKLARSLAFLPGFVTDDYCKFVLQHYGLHARLWSLFEIEKAADALELPPLLAVGSVRFAELDAWRKIQRRASTDEELLQAEGALLFFHRHGCKDAPIWIREIAIQRMAEKPGTSAFETHLRDLLGLVSENDNLRLIAHCELEPPDLSDRDEETAALVRDTISRLGGRPLSPRGQVQKRVGRLIRSLETDLVSVDDQTPIVRELAKIASALCAPGADFLGLDLLAGGIECLGAGPDADVLADAIEYQLTRNTMESLPDGQPPAALFTTRSRLQRMIRGQGSEAVIASQLLGYFDRRFAKFRPHFDPFVAEGDRLNRFHSDVVVAIYSCAANLGTRVEAIRRSWLKALDRRGIPHVVVVGGGDGQMDGDVLWLNVLDDYESLPDKTLALLRWFLTQRQETYLIKIDDDCFLDVDAYFDSLSYRRFHYYGRRISRGVGATDRIWHQLKSTSTYARQSIDRSPEPTVFADGGGGYSLSRFAVAAALAEVDTPRGKRLRASSFMEDKLLGDLLGRRGIQPGNDEYESFQRRRTFPGAVPVAMWENSFFPSRLSPTILVHLDDAKDQEKANALIDSSSLRPCKVWPTYSEIGLVTNSNQLELLTDVERAIELLREDVFVVCVVRNEKVMLDHFLQHYRSLGVRSFIFADNLSDDGSREFLLEQPDVVVYSCDTEYKASHFGVSWQQAILGNHANGKWALVADADELLVLPSRFATLQQVCDALDAENASAACVIMVDMYPKGSLDEADFEVSTPFECAPWFDRNPVIPWVLTSGYYSNSPSFVSRLRHRVLPDSPPNSFTSQKYALMRYSSGVKLSEGIHDAVNLAPGSVELWFAHFKYHRGFQQKVRTEIARGQHFNGAEEYRRYLGMLSESAGGFWDESLSVRFEGPTTFETYGVISTK